MSEHSLEELKRQYDAAVSRANQANKEKSEAAHRYTAKAIADKLAEFAARGITPGSRVRLVFDQWNGGKVYYKEAGFLGVEAGWSPGDAKPIFSRLKKDGTPSKNKWSIFSYSDVEPLDDGGQENAA